MKLIGAITSPYVRKVRIVMAEKKLEYQLVLEDVWAATSTIGPRRLSSRTAMCNSWPGGGDDWI
jgi:glutathione S-transferase